MAWIESHTELDHHPKLLAFAAALRLCPAWAQGHLHVLWHACLIYCEDGDLSQWDNPQIARAAQWPGNADMFVHSLCSHGWADVVHANGDSSSERPTLLIHDWLDYAGLYLTRKYGARNKQRLVEIWAKHGRVYGKASRALNAGSPANTSQTSMGVVGQEISLNKDGVVSNVVQHAEQLLNNISSACVTTTEQQLLIPNQYKEEIQGEGIHSKNEITIQNRQFGMQVVNIGMHQAEAAMARRVVKHYLAKVTGKSPPGNQFISRLVGIMLDHPHLREEDWIRCVDGYAVQTVKDGVEPKYRTGVANFFTQGVWEHYLRRTPEEPTVDVGAARRAMEEQRRRLEGT